ncbi:MAG: hypothetical protein LIR50_16415 [Bacillota bacterium]|nr:hypothetical protein [Bacillota bacterium]
MMRISNKVFTAIILFLVMLGLFIGLYTKSTFVNDLNFNASNFKKINFQYDVDINKIFNNNINDFDNLKCNSPYIISVKPTGERIKYNMGLRTSVKVLNVYKDDEKMIKKGDTIYIFEPLVISTNICISNSGSTPMVNNREYVGCLKNIIKPPWYKYRNIIEKRSFIPSSIFYGKFLLNEATKSTKIDFGKSDIKCQELLNYDLVLLNEDSPLKGSEFFYKYDEVVKTYDKIKQNLKAFVLKK